MFASGTLSMLAFTRSTSAYSCGVEARNVVNTLDSDRIAFARRRSARRSLLAGAWYPQPRAVLHDELEAAGRAEALHRRRRNDEDPASEIVVQLRSAVSRQNLVRRRPVLRSALRTASGRRRSRRRSGCCARGAREAGERDGISRRPGASESSSSRVGRLRSVRSSDAPSGKLDHA